MITIENYLSDGDAVFSDDLALSEEKSNGSHEKSRFSVLM